MDKQDVLPHLCSALEEVKFLQGLIEVDNLDQLEHEIYEISNHCGITDVELVEAVCKRHN